jgi:RNA polymerase sigma factor (sigma-70 family)
MMLELVATDRELLDSFVTGGDSGAFRSLVSRHGPSVLRVCRGVLRDTHEADDAFQATFLVLVRKAPSIDDPERLGAWLRGVAYRTALRARGQAARRRAVETSRAQCIWAEPPPAESTEELWRVITEELERLPESYRQPVTLCYLQGLTHHDAARRLGWPVGTVKVRLVRARLLLQQRLKRRGIAWEAGLLLVLLWSREVSAVPEPVAESTIQAMKLAKAGRRRALEAKPRRAVELAEAILGASIGLKMPWIWAASAIAAVLLMLTGPAVFGFHTPPAVEVDAASLPSNLTDVLTVECR